MVDGRRGRPVIGAAVSRQDDLPSPTAAADFPDLWATGRNADTSFHPNQAWGYVGEPRFDLPARLPARPFLPQQMSKTSISK
jgi:hypothetical protein